MKIVGAFLIIFGFLTTAPDGWHGEAVFMMAVGAVMIYAGSQLDKR